MVVQGLGSGLLHVSITGADHGGACFFVDGIKTVVKKGEIRVQKYLEKLDRSKSLDKKEKVG